MSKKVTTNKMKPTIIIKNQVVDNKTKKAVVKWKKSNTTNTTKTTTTTNTSNNNNTGPYTEVTNFINQLFEKLDNETKTSSTKTLLKSVLYNPKDGTLRCKSNKTFAMVTKIWEYRILLSKLETYLVENSSTSTPQIHNRGLLYVMLYELLLGTKQSIIGGGTLKRYIIENETTLRSFVEQEQGETINKSTTTTTVLPRYVRINTYGLSSYNNIQEIVQRIQQKIIDSNRSNTSLSTDDDDDDTKEITDINQTNNNTLITADPLIPDLVVVPRHLTSILLQRGKDDGVQTDYILQDKSSCFSAYCLAYGFPENDDNDNDNETFSSANEPLIYLDACAAPGNKTSHLAALLWKKYYVTKSDPATSTSSLLSLKSSSAASPSSIRIVAYDRDNKRCQSLQRRMKELLVVPKKEAISYIPSITVEARNEDFLTTTADMFSTGTKQARFGGIIVDPSCSGSGMLSNQHSDERPLLFDPTVKNTKSTAAATTTITDTKELVEGHDDETITNEKDDVGPSSSSSTSTVLQNRLEKLSKFQIKILLHAMSIPNNNRIVYSTCSIYELENEHVIATVLNTNNNRTEWEIIAPKGFESWTRRGNPEYDPTKYTTDSSITPLTATEIASMIRVDPYQGDETNGFFVCCLQRKKQHNSQQEKEKESSPTKQNVKISDSQEGGTGTSKSHNNVNEHLGLPIYQTGMFTTTTTTISTLSKNRKSTSSEASKNESNDSNQKRNIDGKDDDDHNNKKSKKPKVNLTTTTTASTTAQSVTTSPDSNKTNENITTAEGSTDTTTTTSRKQSKKLQWKMKQYKKKRKRVVAKQQQQQQQQGKETKSA